MHFAPGLRPGTPCSQSGYSRTLPTARAVNLQIWPRTSGTPSLLGKNHCPSLVKRKNRPRWPSAMITHWAPDHQNRSKSWKKRGAVNGFPGPQTWLNIELKQFGLAIWWVYGENWSRVWQGRLPIDIPPIQSRHFWWSGPKNKEPSGDCRAPRHDRALVSMDLVRTYDPFSGKIEAECVRKGYPLNFDPSKVVTFGEKMSFFLVYLLNGAK